jgi:outer membrane lipoprotein carrier protein
MKYTIIILLSLAAFFNLNAQPDAKSKSILQKASEINNGYKTITSDFSFSTSDLQSGKTTTEKGHISMKGEKYRLKLLKSDIIFDGKNIYNYLPESNEVNISYPEPAKTENGDFFISNPRDIFKFYNKNFKSKWMKETSFNNISCNEIELYPNDLKTKYTKISMHIDKVSYHILDIKISFKNGTRQTIEFSNFKANNSLPDTDFSFDTKKYPGIVVNDMRF